ncbi:hypothetical protein AWB69_07530 [Caballeronia udeis]|uniref:DUF2817 domain-containing protein n=1 Tax=Caballeronia udeis TaxID=1232866 RepID=A0A158JCK9_9BURK|nr:M14 family metallopeptidase [Caballeronia udeis]SAL66547.1 hypothetical protein AWB69_07530 [Caballeronia udeis]
MTRAVHYFSDSYAHARRQFRDAAKLRGAAIESYILEGHRGIAGEELATDVVRIGADDAPNLLVITSATHGVEGYCGSGCQVALLHDDELLERLKPAGVAVLLVHAINPYGFSYWHRTNEDNIDVNRNFIDFDKDAPVNVRYAELEAHLIPAAWPPSAENEAFLTDYAARQGHAIYANAVGGGQYSSATGMFHGGTFQTWSNRTARRILRQYGAAAERLGWIDVHTGLGPSGHCEKVFVGDMSEYERARAWWGADVFAPLKGDSVMFEIEGPLVSIPKQECPDAESTTIALEYGTIPFEEMLTGLRGDHWLRRHPDADEALKVGIKRGILDGFYTNDDEWKASVLAQFRVAVLQAVQGLQDRTRG